MIFVFGSNLAGIHGAGAALHARANYGAKLGEGVGRTGNAYAIPTKDKNIQTLPLNVIEKHVANFVEYAWNNPNETFLLTPIGCGLAGYTAKEISKILKNQDLPSNVVLDQQWLYHI